MRHLFLLTGLALGACATPGGTDDFDLCSCNSWDRGQRDLKLSQKCIDACLDKFGGNLEGMDEWFRDNCDPQAPKPNTQEEMAHL